MLILGTRIYEDVINVGDKTLVQQILENLIDERLENDGCIGQSIWHDSILIVPLSGDKGCFLSLILTRL